MKIWETIHVFDGERDLLSTEGRSVCYYMSDSNFRRMKKQYRKTYSNDRLGERHGSIVK
jgi:hypothetical protein